MCGDCAKLCTACKKEMCQGCAAEAFATCSTHDCGQVVCSEACAESFRMASEFLSLFNGLAVSDHPDLAKAKSKKHDVATVLRIHAKDAFKTVIPLAIVHMRTINSPTTTPSAV